MRFNYIDPAVDAEELAGLVIEFFQVFTVPVKIRCDEKVRPQVDTVSVRRGCKNKGFKKRNVKKHTLKYHIEFLIVSMAL